MLSLSYLSSTVDWCESNFKISYYICEYMNSISSLFYTGISLFHIWYFIPIVKKKVYWKLLFLNNIILGLSSFLFHATLSELGQCLDELFILTFIFIVASIISNTYYSKIYLLIPVIVFIFFPNLTRFSLLFVGLVIFYLNYPIFLKPYLIKGLCNSFIYFALAFIFWIVDILFCSYLPFSLHWLWHIASALAQHNFICTLIVQQYPSTTYLINLKFGLCQVEKLSILMKKTKIEII